MSTLGFMAGYWLLLDGCVPTVTTSEPQSLSRESVTVRVGEREYVQYDTEGGVASSIRVTTCDGIAELTNDEKLSDLAVDGLAVGTCYAKLNVTYKNMPDAVIDVTVTVIPEDGLLRAVVV